MDLVTTKSTIFAGAESKYLGIRRRQYVGLVTSGPGERNAWPCRTYNICLISALYVVLPPLGGTEQAAALPRPLSARRLQVSEKSKIP